MAEQSFRSRGPIARGNTSEIWPWTKGTVVKVLRPDIPRHWASIEADILWRVHGAGLPVPATDGVVEIEGRPGIVLERIAGDTMWERMKAEPDRLPALVDALVDLQSQVQGTSVEGLPDLDRRLASKIDEAVQVSARDRRRVQSMLADLPAGAALCHGDFHPANIVMADRGVVILDWFDAATGHPDADLVRSSLLMRPPWSESAWPAHLGGTTRSFLESLHDRYLTTLLRRGHVDPGSFAGWEVVLAVARMSEPVPHDDLVGLWRRWQEDGPAAAETMIAACLARVAEHEGTSQGAREPDARPG